MSEGALTAMVAIFGALVAAISGGFAAVQTRKTNSTTVDVRVFNTLREDFLSSKDQIRSLNEQLDEERDLRRAQEDQIAAIARALYRAGIEIPDEVATLMRPVRRTPPRAGGPASEVRP